MGFWGPEEGKSERAARIQGENQREKLAHDGSFFDRQKQAQAEDRYQQQNWENKQTAFAAEQRWAVHENRAPRYMSPAEVPDIPRYVQPAAEVVPREPFVLGKFGGWVIILLVVIVILPMILQLLLTLVVGTLAIAIRVGFWVVLTAIVGVVVVWLVKRATSKGDPEKIRAAQMWNPASIVSASFGVGKDLVRERRERKQQGQNGQ